MTERINQLAKERYYSVRSLAKLSGIEYMHLYRSLRGESKLTADDIIALCKALNVSSKAILGI